MRTANNIKQLGPARAANHQAVGACVGGKPYQAIASNVPSNVCPSSSTPKCSPISTDEYATSVHTHPSAETGGRPPQPPSTINDADIPPEFKEGQYDVLLLYADADRKDAMKFKKILERFVLGDGEPARICVVDENFPWIQSQFAHMDEAIRRSTHIFIYVTELFCNDNGVPSLLVDRQMALVRNYAIQSTGSSIVYTLTLDCLGNKTTQSQQRTRNVVWLCAITKGDIHCLGLSQVGSTSG